MGLQINQSGNRTNIVDPASIPGPAVGTRMVMGDCLMLRARHVVLDLGDIAGAEPVSNRFIDGPYIRFTPDASVKDMVVHFHCSKGDTQGWANLAGVVQTSTVPDNLPDVYWEVDALAQAPFVAPCPGSYTINVGHNGAWFFDGYIFRRQFRNGDPNEPFGPWVYNDTLRQTRYIQEGTTRVLQVPFGAVAFEVHPSVAMPTISVGYEDTPKTVGGVSSLEVISLTSYNIGTPISIGNARVLAVVAATLCRIVWHIALPSFRG